MIRMEKEKKLKGMVVRLGFAGSGIIHGLLAWAVIKMILGGSGSSPGTSEDGITARLMSQPFGIWLVGIVGVIIAVVGSYHIFRGFTGAFKKRLNFSPVSQKMRELLCRTCQFGLIARGLAFCITAWFFMRSALHYNPREAGGLSGSTFVGGGAVVWTVAAGGDGIWAGGLRGLRFC